jgi:opacity protein-like surface antigen
MRLSTKLFALLAAGIAGLSSPTFAEDNNNKGLYTNIYAGASRVTDIDFGSLGTLGFDAGFEYQLGMGYDFGKRFRVEGFFNRSGSDFENSNSGAGYVDIVVGTWGGNALIDFPNDSKITPFIGAGIGSSNIEVTGADDSVTNKDLIAGIGYAVSNNMDIDVKYTYRMFDDITLGSIGITDASQHSILGGLRSRF